MSVLISPEALAERRMVAQQNLGPLTASLAADLEPLLARELYFPEQKALLSRDGGRCARDGSLLDFNPYAPHEHRCPRCGEVYRGEHHDRFWIYWYQLWLAERALHGAVLADVTADDRFLDLSRRILDGYATRYLGYPNVDNVLGPTRLFFSTYLESIWLLQICVAADLIARREPTLVGRIIDRIVEPSRALVAEYDEGGSNRQVWNDVALLASARLLGDRTAAERAVFGGSGLRWHVANNLLPDGTWYEGENYHLFAHRGLWYGITMAELAGFELPRQLIDRFQRGFATPFATALPDFTLPARRDSQYAISLRQWRIAEHCELGVARAEDPVLLGALARMYDAGVPRRDTGRSRSSADAERNAQASALTRADLSWRALLFARSELPAGHAAPPPSALLDAQGLAVFRRDGGRAYVAVDYGHSGGGHGHPDRLNLLLAVDDVRWLDDFGTGSYTDPSLHWYRSTLAHNAPLVNGESQKRVHGDLVAYDEQDSIGWISATAAELAPGVVVSRTVVVMPSYAVDTIRWQAKNDVTLDLPIHADLTLAGDHPPPTTATFEGGTGLEDGSRFLRDTTVQPLVANTPMRANASEGAALLDLFLESGAPIAWWSATAPGAPGAGDRRFRILRLSGAAGTLRLVWSWDDDVRNVEWSDEEIVVSLRAGERHRHRPADRRWAVELSDASSLRTIMLGNTAPATPSAAPQPTTANPLAPIVLPATHAARFELGESHYRRSEQSWLDAGAPTAAVMLEWSDSALSVEVDVPRSDRTFVPNGAVNRYDNEPPDINGDGVELFVRTTSNALAGWMLVPERDSRAVRVRSIDGWVADSSLVARWEPTGSGYRLAVKLPADLVPTAIDVVINEKPLGRERRRGQLVLSGAMGEFVYLRGDRHDPNRLIPLRLENA